MEKVANTKEKHGIKGETFKPSALKDKQNEFKTIFLLAQNGILDCRGVYSWNNWNSHHLIVKTPTDILLFQICTFMLTFIAYLLILLINSDNKEQSKTKKVK